MDINYCQKVMHTTLSKLLNASIFKSFVCNKKVLQGIAKVAFDQVDSKEIQNGKPRWG